MVIDTPPSELKPTTPGSTAPKVKGESGHNEVDLLGETRVLAKVGQVMGAEQESFVSCTSKDARDMSGSDVPEKHLPPETSFSGNSRTALFPRCVAKKLLVTAWDIVEARTTPQ